MKSKFLKRILTLTLVFCVINTATLSSYAAFKLPIKIQNLFTKKKNTNKKQKIEEVQLPPVIQGKPKTPLNQMKIMSIEDCVEYAIKHDPQLSASHARTEAARAGIGIERASYAPKITAKVGYNHNNVNGEKVINSHDNSIGFNVGIAETIWDFGKTTARINMAKYDTKAAEFDHEYELLDVIYDVRINYYRVLSALANLDIYEQNVRIQTLNFERTKAMFEEGLKSKIDIVNAEVNLADAKIQLIEGQKNLLNSIINLQNAMYYQEDKPFIVKNTENFNFLKADYRQKLDSVNSSSQPKPIIKRNEDGVLLLSSGIEHNDIIQDYKHKPIKLTKQEAVDKAMEYRPDLKSTKLVINVQEESLKAIKRSYAPAVNGELTWGYTKSESTYNSPLQVGASIALGSINPYSIHYQIKQGENYLNIAKYNYNIAKSDIYWEVQNNYIDMQQFERKIPLMNTKVKATLENFELADGRYSVGLSNYVELQDALTNYNKSQLSFVETVFKYNEARETLLKSMGLNIMEDKCKNDI